MAVLTTATGAGDPESSAVLDIDRRHTLTIRDAGYGDVTGQESTVVYGEPDGPERLTRQRPVASALSKGSRSMDTISSKPFGRRTIFAGAAGLGLATLVGGSLVRAQETPTDGTPDASSDTTTDEATLREEIEAEAGARYDDFVSRLAANLSISDTTGVDTAIRTTLTDLVDARLEAGEISANDADAARTAITDSPAPLMGIFLAGHGDGQGGFGGRRRGLGGPGMPGDDQPDDGTDDGTDDSTPAARV